MADGEQRHYNDKLTRMNTLRLSAQSSDISMLLSNILFLLKEKLFIF